MIDPGIKVIGHVPPRRRIQIGQPDRRPEGAEPVNTMEALARVAEAHRIWGLIEQSCNGHGAAQ